MWSIKNNDLFTFGCTGSLFLHAVLSLVVSGLLSVVDHSLLTAVAPLAVELGLYGA